MMPANILRCSDVNQVIKIPPRARENTKGVVAAADAIWFPLV
jgi:hypothetical protein